LRAELAYMNDMPETTAIGSQPLQRKSIHCYMLVELLGALLLCVHLHAVAAATCEIGTLDYSSLQRYAA